MKKQIITITGILLALLLALSLTAAAQTDSAGNVFITESNPTEQTVERDLYWVGNSRGFNAYKIGKSLLAAGRDISVSDSEIGGSVRIGAYSLTLNGVDVNDNITAAARSLQMSGVTASGVYLAGNTIYFNGSADHVWLAGNSVTLDGEISGDAVINGDHVVLGDQLQVNGTLTINSGKEPTVPEGAKIGQLVFSETKTETRRAPDAPDAPAEPVKETRRSSGFGKFIRGLFGTLLLAALIYLLLGAEEVSKPGEMLLSRPLPMLGTGFAGLFVIPGVILILLFIGIGFPSAGLLGLLFAIVCIYSLSFAGVTLGKTLLCRYTDNRILNNGWVTSLIGALVFWLVGKIPVIGTFLKAGALIYTLGYFLQTIFLRLRGEKTQGVKGALPEEPAEDVLEPVADPFPVVSDPVTTDDAADDEAEDAADPVSEDPDAEEAADVLSDPEDQETAE